MSKQYRLSDGRVMNVFPETENAFNFSLKQSGLTAELISQGSEIKDPTLQNVNTPKIDDSLSEEEKKDNEVNSIKEYLFSKFPIQALIEQKIKQDKEDNKINKDLFNLKSMPKINLKNLEKFKKRNELLKEGVSLEEIDLHFSTNKYDAYKEEFGDKYSVDWWRRSMMENWGVDFSKDKPPKGLLQDYLSGQEIQSLVFPEKNKDFQLIIGPNGEFGFDEVSYLDPHGKNKIYKHEGRLKIADKEYDSTEGVKLNEKTVDEIKGYVDPLDKGQVEQWPSMSEEEFKKWDLKPVDNYELYKTNYVGKDMHILPHLVDSGRGDFISVSPSGDSYPLYKDAFLRPGLLKDKYELADGSFGTYFDYKKENQKQIDFINSKYSSSIYKAKYIFNNWSMAKKLGPIKEIKPLPSSIDDYTQLDTDSLITNELAKFHEQFYYNPLESQTNFIDSYLKQNLLTRDLLMENMSREMFKWEWGVDSDANFSSKGVQMQVFNHLVDINYRISGYRGVVVQDKENEDKKLEILNETFNSLFSDFAKNRNASENISYGEFLNLYPISKDKKIPYFYSKLEETSLGFKEVWAEASINVNTYGNYTTADNRTLELYKNLNVNYRDKNEVDAFEQFTKLEFVVNTIKKADEIKNTSTGDWWEGLSPAQIVYKHNNFEKNAEDRQVLMDQYGGYAGNNQDIDRPSLEEAFKASNERYRNLISNYEIQSEQAMTTLYESFMSSPEYIDLQKKLFQKHQPQIDEKFEFEINILNSKFEKEQDKILNKYSEIAANLPNINFQTEYFKTAAENKNKEAFAKIEKDYNNEINILYENTFGAINEDKLQYFEELIQNEPELIEMQNNWQNIAEEKNKELFQDYLSAYNNGYVKFTIDELEKLGNALDQMGFSDDLFEGGVRVEDKLAMLDSVLESTLSKIKEEDPNAFNNPQDLEKYINEFYGYFYSELTTQYEGFDNEADEGPGTTLFYQKVFAEDIIEEVERSGEHRFIWDEALDGYQTRGVFLYTPKAYNHIGKMPANKKTDQGLDINMDDYEDKGYGMGYYHKEFVTTQYYYVPAIQKKYGTVPIDENGRGSRYFEPNASQPGLISMSSHAYPGFNESADFTYNEDYEYTPTLDAIVQDIVKNGYKRAGVHFPAGANPYDEKYRFHLEQAVGEIMYNKVNKTRHLALKNAKDVFDSPESIKDIGKHPFWKGFFSMKSYEYIPWIGSLVNAYDGKIVQELVSKKSEDPNYVYTPTEEMLLSMVSIKQTNDSFVSSLSPSYNSGRSMANSLVFMGEMIGSSPIFVGVRSLLKTQLKKNLVKNLKDVTVKNGKIQLGGGLTLPTNFKIADKFIDTFAFGGGVVMQSSIGGGARTADQFFKFITPEYTWAFATDNDGLIEKITAYTVFDEEGKALGLTNEGDSYSKAFFKASGLTLSEYSVEKFGYYLSKMPRGFLNAFPGKKNLGDKLFDSEFMKRATLGHLIRKYPRLRPPGELIKYAQKAGGFNGIIPEVMEEIIQMPISGLITGDPLWQGLRKYDQFGNDVGWDYNSMFEIGYSIGHMQAIFGTSGLVVNTVRGNNAPYYEISTNGRTPLRFNTKKELDKYIKKLEDQGFFEGENTINVKTYNDFNAADQYKKDFEIAKITAKELDGINFSFNVTADGRNKSKIGDKYVATELDILSVDEKDGGLDEEGRSNLVGINDRLGVLNEKGILNSNEIKEKENLEKEKISLIGAIKQKIDQRKTKRRYKEQIKNVKKIIKKNNLDRKLDIVEADTDLETENELLKLFGITKNKEGQYLDSDGNVVTEIAGENIGEFFSNLKTTHGYYIPSSLLADGEKSKIIINKTASFKNRGENVAGHEFYHFFLDNVLSTNPETKIALGESFKSYLMSIDSKGIQDSNFRERLNAYKNADLATQSEEAMALFLDAISSGAMEYKETTFTKIGQIIRHLFKRLGLDITLDSGKDVYNFIKDFNHSINNGEFSNEQINALEKKIKVGDNIRKIANEVKIAQEKQKEINIESSKEQIKQAMLRAGIKPNETEIDKLFKEINKLNDENKIKKSEAGGYIFNIKVNTADIVRKNEEINQKIIDNAKKIFSGKWKENLSNFTEKPVTDYNGNLVTPTVGQTGTQVDLKFLEKFPEFKNKIMKIGDRFEEGFLVDRTGKRVEILTKKYNDSVTDRLRNELVENNLPLAYDLAKNDFEIEKNKTRSSDETRPTETAVTLEDFQAEYVYELSEMARRWDPSKGVPFGAFINDKRTGLPIKQGQILRRLGLGGPLTMSLSSFEKKGVDPTNVNTTTSGKQVVDLVEGDFIKDRFKFKQSTNTDINDVLSNVNYNLKKPNGENKMYEDVKTELTSQVNEGVKSKNKVEPTGELFSIFETISKGEFGVSPQAIMAKPQNLTVPESLSARTKIAEGVKELGPKGYLQSILPETNYNPQTFKSLKIRNSILKAFYKQALNEKGKEIRVDNIKGKVLNLEAMSDTDILSNLGLVQSTDSKGNVNIEPMPHQKKFDGVIKGVIMETATVATNQPIRQLAGDQGAVIGRGKPKIMFSRVVSNKAKDSKTIDTYYGNRTALVQAIDEAGDFSPAGIRKAYDKVFTNKNIKILDSNNKNLKQPIVNEVYRLLKPFYTIRKQDYKQDSDFMGIEEYVMLTDLDAQPDVVVSDFMKLTKPVSKYFQDKKQLEKYRGFLNTIQIKLVEKYERQGLSEMEAREKAAVDAYRFKSFMENGTRAGNRGMAFYKKNDFTKNIIANILPGASTYKTLVKKENGVKVKNLLIINSKGDVINTIPINKDFKQEVTKDMVNNNLSSTEIQQREQAAQEHWDYLNNIMSTAVKVIKNTDNSYSNIEIAMLSSGFLGNMKTSLRASAVLKYLPYNLNIKNPKSFVYEHGIPAKVVMLHLIDHHLYGNKINLKKLKDSYSVGVISLKMNDNFGRIFKDKMHLGYAIGDQPTKRWYNTFTGKGNLHAVIDTDGNIHGQQFVKLSNIAAQNISDIKLNESVETSNRKKIKYSKTGKSVGMSTYDFDDTLGFTKSGVRVTMPNPSGKPKPKRKVIFLAGGAGSGKGNVINKLGLEKQGFKIVNQDISLEWLKKNHGLPENMNDLTKEQRSTLGKLGHQARGIARRKMMKYQGEGNGVIVDGTGGSVKQMQNLVKEFKSKGYDVSMLFVDTSLDVALGRNRARKERSLLDSIVKRNHEAVQSNKPTFKNLFGNRFMEINTDKLTQESPMPKKLTNKVNDFVSGYEKIRLDATEFAERGSEILEQGGKFDFSEFNDVVDGKPGPLLDKAKKRAAKFGTKDMFVLTARPQASAKAIHEFLKSQGLNIPLKNITGLANSSGQAKAQWMLDKFAEGYNDMYFVDDALQNVEAVKEVLNQLDIKSKVVQAKIKFSKTASKTFNEILERRTGVGAENVFSSAEARKRGSQFKIDRFIKSLYIPPSAEDFKGLLYHFIGKGKQGEADMIFFGENLLKPFAKGIRAWNTYKQNMINDFHKLNKEFPNVKKNINKKVPGTSFTNDTAIRVYLWDKAGFDIPGISKTLQKKLVNHVNKNEELKAFAEGLSVITKRKTGYTKPSENWMVESIPTDLRNVVDKIGRKEFLEEWVNNKDIIFSKDNMNKIRALYGDSFVEALENILYRMENGTNRIFGDSRSLNWFTDWINGSIGAIMFFNTRSALLQTISTVNFINWSDNNMFKASAAFANQKQFWKDFVMLFNSDQLKQRRKGLQVDVSSAELTKSFKERGFSPVTVVSYLLQKGFLPTQIADSFAIAFGGASFYRNRYNKYLKQGMSPIKAKNQAMLDFQEIAEETQQSSREDLISQQQASPLGRIVLAFQNVTMQYGRLTKKALSDIINNRGDMKTNISKVIYYGAVQNVVFAALQSALAFLIWGDEEEELIKDKTTRMFNTCLDSFLRGTGLYGALASTLKNTIIQWDVQKDKSFGKERIEKIALELINLSPPIGSKVRKVVKAYYADSWNEDLSNELGWKLENPKLTMAANLIEASFNIPLARLLNKANNLEEAITGNHEMWKRIALFSGWSAWELGIEDEDIVEAEESIKDKKEQEKKKEKEEKEKLKEEEKKKEEEEKKEKGIKTVRCSGIRSNGERCNMKTETAEKTWLCVHHMEFTDGMDRDGDGIKEYRCTAIKSNGKRCNNKTENKNKKCYAHQ